MNVRAIALALPLVVGIAACKTSSTQSGQTASTTEPSQSSQNQTTAGHPETGGDASASATVDPGATSGSAQGGASASTSGETSGSASGAYGSAPGGASASGDVKAHASDEVVSGKVSRVSEREIAITSDTGEERTLALEPQTVVTIDGRDATRTELKEGQEVRASYNTVYGRETAVEIHAGRDAGSGSMMHREGDSSGMMHGSDMGTGMGSTGSSDTGSTTGTDSTGTSDTGSTTAPPDATPAPDTTGTK